MVVQVDREVAAATAVVPVAHIILQKRTVLLHCFLQALHIILCPVSPQILGMPGVVILGQRREAQAVMVDQVPHSMSEFVHPEQAICESLHLVGVVMEVPEDFSELREITEHVDPMADLVLQVPLVMEEL